MEGGKCLFKGDEWKGVSVFSRERSGRRLVSCQGRGVEGGKCLVKGEEWKEVNVFSRESSGRR